MSENNVEKTKEQEAASSLANQLVMYLKEEFRWFNIRWDTLEMKQKTILMQLLAKDPSFCLHLATILRKNINEEGMIKDELWYCTSQELDLLTMVALPYDESEFVLTDDTGVLDINGNKIMRDGKSAVIINQ